MSSLSMITCPTHLHTRRCFTSTRLCTAVFCMLLASASIASDGESQPSTVRDCVWVWTHSEIAGDDDVSLDHYAHAGPARRAALLDVPNVILGGFGMPNDHAAATAITHAASAADRLVWKIAVDGELVTSGKDGKSGYAWYDQRAAQVHDLADRFPPLRGVMIDDLSTVALRGGMKGEHVANLRKLLAAPYDRIRLWGELYTSSLHNFVLRQDGNDYGLTDLLRGMDVLVLTEWNAANLPQLEENVGLCRRLFPDQKLMINIVLYDYDGHRQVPMAMLKHQCSTALRLLHAGRISGILVTASIDDPQALDYVARWLKRVGDQKIGRPDEPAQRPPPPDPDALTPPQPPKISKFNFMYHPVCWSMQMSGDVPGARIPKPHDRFLATFKREVAVVERQKRMMAAMKPDEVLVLFPNGYSRAMFVIEQYATEMLGRRCVIIRNVHPDVPAEWRKLDDPVGRLLDDPLLEGRDQWLEGVPPRLVEQLFDEVRQAHADPVLEVSLSTVEVVFASRIFAEQILAEFDRRNLYFDDDTVTGESFGEGFEECAMTWKQMLVPYLGIKQPVPNRYDLSVSGAKFLLNARPTQRLPLDHGTYLYLWEDENGSPIGLFARARCGLNDPPYYVTVTVDQPAIEVWGYGGGRFHPNPDSSLQPVEGRMKLNVYSGIRRGPDGLFYLRGGPGTTYEQFRDSLVHAPISE